MSSNGIALLIILIMIVLNGVGQGVLKATAINTQISSNSRIARLLLAYSFSAIGVILSIFLLSVAPISALTVVISAHFVVSAVVGHFVFKEYLSKRNCIGIALITIGAMLCGGLTL